MSTTEKTANARYWYLENTRDGHKFYEVWAFGTTCVLSWGRISTDGQSKVHTFDTETDALAKALSQVYTKRTKGYELKHNDLVVAVSLGAIDMAEFTVRPLRRDTLVAIDKGDAEPREIALNYVDGFIDDCNEYLAKAKEQGKDAELEATFADLNERWAELKDKFESAETIMQMVTARTLKRA